MSDQYANAGKLWTSEEEDRLRHLFHEGKTLNEMCEALKRSSAGIGSRLAKLALIDQSQAEYLQKMNWLCVPSELGSTVDTAESSTQVPILFLPIQHNAVAADPVGFNNFLSWVRRIGNEGCRPGIRGEIGRFFNYERYLSVSDVCYQLQQVPAQTHYQTKAHRLIFSFGDSLLNPQEFLTHLWKRFWKTKIFKPFHWYGIHHRYTDNFHVHVLIEGCDWDWNEIHIGDHELGKIEAIAEEIGWTINLSCGSKSGAARICNDGL